ncbi:MAG: peptidoglycan DD-metalloendopeptidase family protein [Elusimicrobiota bacterium]
MKTKIVLGSIFFTVFIMALIFGYNMTRKERIKEPSIIISSGTFSQGESFYSVLKNENFKIEEMYAVINTLAKEVSARSLRPGHEYIIEKSTSNNFLSFTYLPGIVESYKVTVSSKGVYSVAKIVEELKKEYVGFTGEIKSSLYEGMVSNPNGSASLAVKFADIFAWQIDFLTEPREGDKFKLVYESMKSSRGHVIEGRVVAAQYISKSNTDTAVYFNGAENYDGYYDLKGRSMYKAFLRSPMNYRRISSYFSKSRMHPILKYRRPHLGIDYAAPRGTPIVTIGDGKVIFVGRNGGYGKQVKIRHNSNYETWYAHLNGYAKGVKTGAHVKQGQVIGYCGSTGMATGPHLDFRMKKSGSFVNFLAIKIPAGKTIPAKFAEEFSEIKKDLLAKLYLLT